MVEITRKEKQKNTLGRVLTRTNAYFRKMMLFTEHTDYPKPLEST